VTAKYRPEDANKRDHNGITYQLLNQRQWWYHAQYMQRYEYSQ